MYLNYFGLREAPFNLTPDPKFFFNSEHHREALAGLYYGIKSKKGFIVVTGEVGTGKTTVIRKLLRNLEATHKSVFIFNTLLTFDELFEAILRDLDLEPAPGRVAMHQQLNEFLLDQVKMGNIVSLLIDEAQNLGEESLEAVRLLSNLETDREKLLQIILIGQPELDVKLNGRSLRQLKQRVSLWCRLNRLSQLEVEAYIAHRLAIAGYDGPEIFPKTSLQTIWEQSGGIPRLINSICDNALLTAFAMSEKIVSPEIIHDVLQDLRLLSEAQGPHIGLNEPQTLKKSPARVTDIGDVNGRNKNWNLEVVETSRVSRAAAEVVNNSVLKHARMDTEWRSGKVAEHQSPRLKNDARAGEHQEFTSWVGESGKAPVKFSQSHLVVARPKPGSSEVMVLSPVFSDDLIAALTDAMGPMASVVVREEAAALGESWEQFPTSRLGELLHALKADILSDDLREVFEEQIAQQLNRGPGSDFWRNPRQR
jgi:general secretion pathway protein A